MMIELEYVMLGILVASVLGFGIGFILRGHIAHPTKKARE